MTRGRPFQPGNQFGQGRPKGSRNKNTLQAQKLFEDNSAAIMALAINKCREDPHILRMLAGYVVPRRRDLPLNLGRLPLKTLQDLDRASETTLRKATSGKIGLHQALDICNMIENRRRVLETQDLERRLRSLEDASRQATGG
jgi:hypothetical protein